MVRLANFTLHDQTEYIEKWRECGFEVDPVPRAPFVEFEKPEWTEERILQETQKALAQIKNEGFEAVMIGGLSNVMAYAWFIASRLGLRVVMSKTPRIRGPNGKPMFVFSGWQELFPPEKVIS